MSRLGFPNDDKIAGVCGQPWQQVIVNAGDAHIDGVMVELDLAATDQLTVGMNYEYMEAETDTTADLNGNGDNDLVAGLTAPERARLQSVGVRPVRLAGQVCSVLIMPISGRNGPFHGR